MPMPAGEGRQHTHTQNKNALSWLARLGVHRGGQAIQRLRLCDRPPRKLPIHFSQRRARGRERRGGARGGVGAAGRGGGERQRVAVARRVRGPAPGAGAGLIVNQVVSRAADLIVAWFGC